MKKVSFILAGLLMASVANADVTALSVKFGGGCSSTNTGTCTIKVTASGTDLDQSAVVLQRGTSQKGPWRYVSKTSRSLSATGRAQFRFANQDGWYRAVTAPNGNDAADIRSRAIQEK